jgi:hypothetical protein
LTQARTYNTYSQSFVRGLLEADRARSATPAMADVSTRNGGGIGADLQVYQRLLEVRP